MYGFDLNDVLAALALVAGLAFIAYRLTGMSLGGLGKGGSWSRLGHQGRNGETGGVSRDGCRTSYWEGSGTSYGAGMSGYGPLDRTPADMINESYAGYGAEDIFGRSNNLHDS